MQCVVNVKVASLSLGNILSLTQTHQSWTPERHRKLPFLSRLWFYFPYISSVIGCSLDHLKSEVSRTVTQYGPWVLCKREACLFMFPGPRPWVDGWVEWWSENCFCLIYFLYHYSGLAIIGLSLSYPLHWMTWWEIMMMIKILTANMLVYVRC